MHGYSLERLPWLTMLGALSEQPLETADTVLAMQRVCFKGGVVVGLSDIVSIPGLHTAAAAPPEAAGGAVDPRRAWLRLAASILEAYSTKAPSSVAVCAGVGVDRRGAPVVSTQPTGSSDCTERTVAFTTDRHGLGLEQPQPLAVVIDRGSSRRLINPLEVAEEVTAAGYQVRHVLLHREEPATWLPLLRRCSLLIGEWVGWEGGCSWGSWLTCASLFGQGCTEPASPIPSSCRRRLQSCSCGPCMPTASTHNMRSWLKYWGCATWSGSTWTLATASPAPPCVQIFCSTEAWLVAAEPRADNCVGRCMLHGHRLALLIEWIKPRKRRVNGSLGMQLSSCTRYGVVRLWCHGSD